MIHTKLLIRRLAYVPWLLAFGLMLGWAGEAVAQNVKLTVSASSMREDGGAKTFTVTATNYSDGAHTTKAKVTDAPKYVLLDFVNSAEAGTPSGLNVNYTATQAVITIAKDADAGTADITITPIVRDAAATAETGDLNLDFTITITGNVGSFDTDGVDATDSVINFIDTHKNSTAITLSFDPAEISREAGPTDITVTGTLNGETVTRHNLSFPLVVVGTGSAVNQIATAPTGTEGVRDTDYNITGLGKLTIPRKKPSGKATFVVDPAEGPRWVGIGTTVAVNTAATTNASGLFYDGTMVADDAATTDTDESLDRDSSGDGTNDTNREQQITVTAGLFRISEANVAAIKAPGDGGLVATPASVREEVGTVEVALKVVLAKAVTDDEQVNFTVTDFEGDNAERDINYTIEFGSLTIPAGDTEGTTTATLTIVDDEAGGGNRTIRVNANVDNSTQSTDITITDNDLLTENITLSAAPGTVKEDAGLTEVEITATIDGAVFDDDLKLTLVLAAGGATRDVDYTATLRSLTIPAGEVSASKTIDIIPIDDGIADADEKITVTTVEQDLKNDDDDPITIKNAEITLGDTGVKAAPTDPDDTTPAFSEEDALASATAIEGTAGKALEDVVLPAAEGDGDLSYSVSANLPDGLSFDTASRTLSGTPSEAGMTGIVYTVVDGDTGDELPAESAVLTYTIEISEPAEPTTMVESVSVSQLSVRESGETASISVKATLAGPAPKAETIRFTLGAPSVGVQALRDVDFSAVLHGNVAIAEGATEATTSLSLTPIDNTDTDGNRVIGVHATASGGSASADITIADDETASTSISLSADPHTVSEPSAEGISNEQTVEVTVTATLDGKVLDAAATVSLSVDPNSEATRDVDYRAVFVPTLTIPAGEVSGTTRFLINTIYDGEDEGNETITLNGAIEGLDDGTGLITIADAAMMPPEMEPLAFAEGAMIASFEATAGTPINDMVLPEATVGAGDITYSTSELPAGLSFDAETRTLSGTPEAEGTTEVTYTATAGDESVDLTFSITVNAMLDFGDIGALLGLLGAGKANPAQDDGAGLQLNVGVPVELTLPEIPGGTGDKTYSMTGLPPGLSFDPATRTISGTPTEEATAVVILTVTDAVGATGQAALAITVVLPPLDPPDLAADGTPLAQDYKGADGAGDQGGFILMTWALSDNHADLDGYRIFRHMPVLGNEPVPWAMVDAVPGVAVGRAIVATLDNVATDWAIAAESGGRTTHGAAKAVFISGDNPYELMAETMTASREAAQAGNGPVFASLLPEALAYAQGVAPKLNLVGGVAASSALLMTEEPVRAIDDIAPLAVPSLSALDAPNDAGSRIALTWTLSPSDQLLQGVIAGAIGPTALEPIVGVHGYSIHRRAAGEEEFVLVGQVDAGVTSFVDETALNGVHYTYQVRPFDLDNETASDIEQTAMAVRNIAVDSEGNALFGLFGADNRIGFDDFFIFADNFGLTAEDAGFDPAFDLAPSAQIDFDDFFVFADNFGRSTAAAGKRVPMLAGLNADARLYLDARTSLPNVGEDFVLDVRLADFAAIKGYGLQVGYEADKLAFVEVLTDQPLGGSELATPQVLADQAGVLTVAAHGDVVSDGEVMLSLVFRPTTEIENTIIEITDNQTYDSAFGFNRLGLPAPVQLQTRPEVFSLANNYPNPFNPATTIKYALPQAADVELTVYNVLGQPVRTLVAEHQSAGRYVVEWDATNDGGHSLSSGMYFYRLEASGEFREVKKMLLLK